MVSRKHKYYVEYVYEYEIFLPEDNEWFKDEMCDAEIVCNKLKRDIQKYLKEKVLNDLKSDNIRNFKFKITDMYLTSDDACL
jgi:hypothetical protein